MQSCVNQRVSYDTPGHQQEANGLKRKSSLPKGVTRGCLHCADCQRVLARWVPEKGCRPVLDEAPVFYPNEEEFKDTLKYIASIRPIAEPYGICRIVPPASWKPLCPFRDNIKWQQARFNTRIQQVHKLQLREASFSDVRTGKLKRRSLSRASTVLEHEKHLLNAENLQETEGNEFGFDSGPAFSLESFQKYANEFKEQYFGVQKSEPTGTISCVDLSHNWKPSVENIEGEYWRIIENPTEEIEVLYGADLETSNFGSGFPKANFGKSAETSDPYVTSGWNLNNIARLPGSMLSFEEETISGVIIPWLYVGMCFSSFCWHVEDHHFYSLNYLHWGAPKVWYGVPGSRAVDFEQAMKKHLPHLFEEQPDLLQKLVTQFSPRLLKLEAVPVYRCVQQAKEFVLTFPRAYHAGFNSGFNCAEAVNVAPVDWLPYGQRATKIYKQLCRKTTVSHDKLLLGAAREAVKILWNFLTQLKFSNVGWQGFCGKDGLLTKALKARIEEHKRECIIKRFSNRHRMDKNFDSAKERECFLCFYDLYLFAVSCACSPEKFACIEHSNKLCSCPRDSMFLLYRYDIDELDTLIEAVEGKQNAISKWASCNALFEFTKSSEKVGSASENRKPLAPSMNYSKKKETITYTTDNGKNKVRWKVLPQTKEKEPKTNIETIILSDDENECIQTVKDEDRLVSDVNSASVDSTKGRLPDVARSTKGNLANRNLTCNKTDVMDSSFSSGENISSSNYAETSINLSHENPFMNNSQEEYDLHASGANTENADFVDRDMELHSHIRASVTLRQQMQRTNASGSPANPVNNLMTESTAERTGALAGKMNKDDEKISDLGCSNTIEGEGDCGTSGIASSSNGTFDVELLNVGVLNPYKYWNNSRAIFPKGFKSRVTYYNILDPVQKCNYVSEILDAGMECPLFKVTMEDCPTETFIHISVQKCWELVQERLNREVSEERNLCGVNNSSFKYDMKIDGFKMFGLMSIQIVQEIESLDPYHQCIQYWGAKVKRSHEHAEKGFLTKNDRRLKIGIVGDSNSSSERHFPFMDEMIYHESNSEQLSSTIADVLDSLFKKASPHELWVLHKVLSSETWSTNWKTAFNSLIEHLKRL